MRFLRDVFRRGVPQASRAAGSGEPAASVGRDAVTERWNQLARPEFVRDLQVRSWTGLPQIHLNHNFLVTGDPQQYWVAHLRERYFPSGAPLDVLSLGCGDGHLDRILKGCGFVFRSLTGYDISPAAVARAAELAAAADLAPRVTYEVADLNVQTFEDAQYDFAYFFQSLHHIEALEHALDQVRRALRPGGFLLVNEFVGPSRFQWTARQKAWATDLLRRLPDALRVDLLHGDGRLKDDVVAPSVEDMVLGDPSEAVRSADIEPALRAAFDVVGEWNWGGTLNYLVFENIAGNFDAADPYHCALVDLLIHHENLLIAQGLIPSDFKVYMARPRH